MWKLLLFFLVIIIAIFFKTDVDLPMLLLPYEIKDSFSGKVVWIAGASGGIGASLALDMVKAGAQVVISARRSAQLEVVADVCAQHGVRPYVLPLDVTDFSAQQVAFDKIVEKFGRVDSLVLNAGVGQRDTAVETALSVTQDLMNLNFMSLVSLSKVVLPSMIERKNGQIVVVSSLSGIVATPIGTSYSATKFALNGYFTSLRSEVSNQGISVTIACPGPVESEFGAHAYKNAKQTTYPATKRMHTDRCSYLIAKGMHYKFMEVWIADQPYLALAYFAQYVRFLNNLLYAKVLGPMFLKVFENGGNMFDVNELVK